MVKIGDNIGIGNKSDNKVSLYCTVEKVTQNSVTAYVINGAWTAKLYQDGTLEAYSGDHLVNMVFDQQILFIGYAGDEYNEAIYRMNDYLAQPWIFRKIQDGARKFQSVTRKARRLSDRFSKACQAFVNVWNGRTPHNDPLDDIPF